MEEEERFEEMMKPYLLAHEALVEDPEERPELAAFWFRKHIEDGAVPHCVLYSDSSRCTASWAL